ncbi:MAG: gamma-glutamyltransferase [Anaerolineales bacterium]
MPGVIAAGNSYTANAGAEMLRLGGNAVDAAVAAAFASCLAEPALVNIGGSGIAQVFNPQTGQTTVYDFFSTMPGIGSEEGSGIIDFRRIYIDFGSARQPFYIGRASVAVPGLVKGLCQMLAEVGSLPLATVLAPAIELARSGITLDAQQAHMIKLVSPILLDTPELAAYFKRDGQLVQAGDVIRYPLLANTLEQLAQQGPDLFYSGEIGRAIVQDQRRKGGFVTAKDLQAYEVHQVPPIEVPYRDYTLLLPSAASMGGVLIAFSLKLLSVHSLAGVKPHSLEHIRLLAEVMRLTNQARVSWDVKRNQEGALDYFLSEAHLAPYRRNLQTALNGGTPSPDPKLPPPPPNTTHISVADQNGMIVALTHSPGENAGFVLGNTGVTLNNMLGEMDLHPKGFHLLAPGERLQTMMAPVLALKDGRPVLAIGSGGSNRLRTAILQTVVNVIDFGMSLEQAILAPRVHFEEDVLQLEGGIEREVAVELDMYQVNRWTERSMFFGGAHAVAREGGQWVAAGDPRRGGSAVTVS